MKGNTGTRARAVGAVAALGLAGLFLGATPAIAGPTARSASIHPAPPGEMITWHLARGGTMEAAFVGYSLQSRTLTLREPSGKVTHLHPQDLTASSKLQWLISPVFIESLKGYRPPRKAWLKILVGLSGPALAMAGAMFLAFWMASSLVAGERRFGRVATTYLRCGLYAMLIGLVTLFMLRAVAIALGDSPVAPMMHTVALVTGIGAMLLVISCRVAGDYCQSGLAGFGTWGLTGGISALMGTIFLYLTPRLLERPGLDDWLTDRLLAPLGLA